ncbi:calcineurin-like phosphoesterase family protein [Sphingomonas insulae]|uniref:Metallophosphoesterase family protein n=1 Tax=Sphingomonas insulae TaxID=424800 RepID=A0ABP3T184_9SPHN|nr:metallophosphoesterase [Sphingomonas insulae]NIJ28578.1 calcineurin-like phosphoesterase family protein [Sphingomonas insulae]
MTVPPSSTRGHNGATWFTADTHFGDHRTLNIHKRPFASVAAMDAALVAGWNACVAPDDTIWHLGDVARRLADVAGLLAGLNGIKHLIRGNNDDPAIADVPGWASVRDYAEIALDDRFLVLCHYPLRSWNRQHRGAIDLHGHSHGRLKPMPRQFDVGVDPHGFQPVALGELLGEPTPAIAATG